MFNSTAKARSRTENELLVERVENSAEIPYKCISRNEEHQKEVLSYLESCHYLAVTYTWAGHEYAVYVWR